VIWSCDGLLARRLAQPLSLSPAHFTYSRPASWAAMTASRWSTASSQSTTFCWSEVRHPFPGVWLGVQADAERASVNSSHSADSASTRPQVCTAVASLCGRPWSCRVFWIAWFWKFCSAAYWASVVPKIPICAFGTLGSKGGGGVVMTPPSAPAVAGPTARPMMVASTTIAPATSDLR